MILLLIPAITGTKLNQIREWINATVSDGQLCWAAIGISTTAAYDAFDLLQKRRTDAIGLEIVIFFLGVISFISAIVVKDASITAFDFGRRLQNAYLSNQPLPVKNMGAVFMFSVVATAGAVMLACLVHFGDLT
jgi:hypothetical protein